MSAIMIPERVRRAVSALPAPRCAYAYDRATLIERATALRAALPTGSTMLYAIKANSHPDVLDALAGVVDGFEVASGGELALARIARAGRGAAHQIVFGGPAKTETELDAAVEAEATINVESLLELRRLAVVAETAGMRVPTVLRVNRAGATLPGHLRMSGVPTPFGLDEADLPEAVEFASGHPALRLSGFALHAVSNNLDAAAHAAFVAEAVRWSARAADALRIALDIINVGGGLGLSYTLGPGFDLDVFAKGLAAVEIPAGARLVFEPGRFLAGPAGFYAAEVLDLKRTQGRWFAVLRGGTHHLRLPAAWGHSQPFAVIPIEPWPHLYDRPAVESVEVDVVGELCTPRDVLARSAPVERLRVGDVLAFALAGAYGWEISHHEFLHHEPPRFVIT